jgi:8-oxo-dGTP pyrophosphatase MutT (NUDIX family)
MSQVLIKRDREELKSLIKRSLFVASSEQGQSSRIGGIPLSESGKVAHLVPVDLTPAAVLMLIIDRPEGLSLLLTQRSSKLRSHAGQISFPGGRIEMNDLEPQAAALRETEEEIGLSREHVEIVGYLAPHVVFSGFAVIPVVGFVNKAFRLNIESAEVESVFEVPLSFLLNSQNHLFEQRQLGAISVPVHYFQYTERRIWGMTAGMIMHLYERLMRELKNHE